MLEGGECLVFASGMAAISAVLLTVARPGAAVVLPADGYYKTRAFATSTLDGLGVTVRLAPTLETAPPYDGAALVLLESPANPGLDVCDIAALSGPACPPTRRTGWRCGRCGASRESSRSPWPIRPRSTGSCARPGWSPRRPRSAACTPAPTGAPSGATTRRPAWYACRAASRTPPTSWPTSGRLSTR